MAADIHLGDYGTVFQFTIKDESSTVVDISNLGVRQVIFKKPDGTKLSKTPSLGSDGTDGVINYTIASGDLDTIGMWEVQARVSNNSSQNWYTDVQTFKVFANIE